MTRRCRRRSGSPELCRVDVSVQGIPATASVKTYHHHPGRNSYLADSDLDCYGYTECEFRLLDRRGYPAPWLEAKLSDPVVYDNVFEQVVQEVAEFQQDERETALERRIEERRERAALFNSHSLPKPHRP